MTPTNDDPSVGISPSKLVRALQSGIYAEAAIHSKAGGASESSAPLRIGTHGQLLMFTVEGTIRALTRGRLKGLSHVGSVVLHAYNRWLHLQQVDGAPGWSPPGDPLEIAGWLLPAAAPVLRPVGPSTSREAIIARRGVWSEQRVNESKGSAVLTRVLPIVSLGYPDGFERVSEQIAPITHGHPEAHLAAGAIGDIMSALIAGLDLDASAAAAVRRAGTGSDSARSVVTAIEAGLALEPTETNLRKVGAGMTAADALTASVSCLRVEDPVALAISAHVNRATASLIGQLAGLMPARRLPEAQEIDRVVGIALAAQLGTDLFSHVSDPAMASADWGRYPGW